MYILYRLGYSGYRVQRRFSYCSLGYNIIIPIWVRKSVGPQAQTVLDGESITGAIGSASDQS